MSAMSHPRRRAHNPSCAGQQQSSPQRDGSGQTWNNRVTHGIAHTTVTTGAAFSTYMTTSALKTTSPRRAPRNRGGEGWMHPSFAPFNHQDSKGISNCRPLITLRVEIGQAGQKMKSLYRKMGMPIRMFWAKVVKGFFVTTPAIRVSGITMHEVPLSNIAGIDVTLLLLQSNTSVFPILRDSSGTLYSAAWKDFSKMWAKIIKQTDVVCTSIKGSLQQSGS